MFLFISFFLLYFLFVSGKLFSDGIWWQPKTDTKFVSKVDFTLTTRAGNGSCLSKTGSIQFVVD
jgi:hypothetical protein